MTIRLWQLVPRNIKRAQFISISLFNTLYCIRSSLHNTITEQKKSERWSQKGEMRRFLFTDKILLITNENLFYRKHRLAIISIRLYLILEIIIQKFYFLFRGNFWFSFIRLSRGHFLQIAQIPRFTQAQHLVRGSKPIIYTYIVFSENL